MKYESHVRRWQYIKPLDLFDSVATLRQNQVSKLQLNYHFDQIGEQNNENHTIKKRIRFILLAMFTELIWCIEFTEQLTLIQLQ